MAVEMVESRGLWKKFQGLTADVKPEDDEFFRVGNGSEYYDLETKLTYVYSIGNTTGGEHWWEK